MVAAQARNQLMMVAIGLALDCIVAFVKLLFQMQ